MQPLLIVKTGTAPFEVSQQRGDYEEWIRVGLGLPADRVRVASTYLGEPLPDPSTVAGVVVTGSSAMVSERVGWSERTAHWISKAVEAKVPLLGICYGHQLLAHALGGRVGPNPRGREIGTVEVCVDGAAGDRLLSVLPTVAVVQATHVESALELPRGIESVAASALDPHHAFAAGPCAWGVQFHPEFDADIMRGYLEVRRALLAQEGLDPDALIAAAKDAPHGTALLRRFGEIAQSRGA